MFEEVSEIKLNLDEIKKVQKRIKKQESDRYITQSYLNAKTNFKNISNLV